MDATALATLQVQLRVLAATLNRLGRARRDLVPATSTFWSGPARDANDAIVLDVAGELGSALDLVLFAQQNTMLAISEELRRA
jgi:hypothetical protein